MSTRTKISIQTHPSPVLRTLRAVVVQTDAGTKVHENLRSIETLLKPVDSCDLIALPEVFAIRGSDQDYRDMAEVIPGATSRWLSALAESKKSWVIGGSIIEKQCRRFYNTCLVFDRAGRLRAKYRKIHLFEAFLDTGDVVRERDIYSHGNTPSIVTIEGWRAGLAICYDLRFPELFRHYSRRAHLFFIPSNFTQRTGKDHWNILIRARAIENQCFVIAPNQCGKNPVTGIASYGHSLAVGPWGDILCRASSSPCMIACDLNPEPLFETRRRIPVLSHRRIG